MIERLVAIRVTDAGVLAGARRAMAARADWRREALACVRAHGVFEEAVLLATCERLEVYGVLSGAALDPREAVRHVLPRVDEMLYGEAAARHLLRVAAGLDSRIVGETHVLGQVAAAFREAESVFAADAVLKAAFESATRTGRRVRGETELGRLAGSYVSAAVGRVGGLFEEEDRPRIAVLGGGAMARQLVQELIAAGFVDVRVFTRHPERVAKELRGVAEIASLSMLRRELVTLDAVIAATSSPRAIVTEADVEGLDRVERPLTFVDLGMPANIETDVTRHAGVRLIGLSDLAGPSHSRLVVAAAEEIVRRELDRLSRKLAYIGEKRRVVA